MPVQKTSSGGDFDFWRLKYPVPAPEYPVPLIRGYSDSCESRPAARGIQWRKEEKKPQRRPPKKRLGEERAEEQAELARGRSSQCSRTMKLQDYRDDFYTFSGKASDLNRQLGFAAIAIIWLFKKDVAGQVTIPPNLIWPGIFVVTSLTLDMMHYCLASIIWRVFYRIKEKAGVGEDANITHDVWLERPIWVLFTAKIICIIVAYIGIGIFLIGVLPK